MATYEVRERVLMNGPGALSDADLLALYGAEALAGVALAERGGLAFLRSVPLSRQR